MARRFKTTVQLDSGLLIPAGAVAGKVLTTDASGNATWQTVTAGAPGLNGSVIYSGMGSPPANVGLPGDYWFDTNTSTMYGPKGTNANSSLNLHPNPSVETDLTGWTSTASSGGPATVRERTTDWAVHGSWSYHVSFGRIPAASSTINTGPTAGTTGKIPVDSAKRYSFQLYHRIRSIVATPPQIMLRIYWYKADGSASTVLGSTVMPYIAVAAGDVVRFVAYNIAPPSDAAYVVPNLYMGSVDSWDSDTDAVVVVEGATLPQEWPTSGTVLKGATGATGPTGPQGPQGDTPVILASSLPAHAARHDAGGADQMVANANYLTPSLRSLDPSQAGSAMNGQWSLANISSAILNGGNVEMNSKKLINLATPTSINDAANKGYVDGKAVPEVKVSTTQPAASEVLWLDTDEPEVGASSAEVAYRANVWGPSLALIGNTWKTLTPAAGGGTISPAGAFTENADGSVTVRDAGWYHLSAFAYFIGVAGSQGTLTIGPTSGTAENYSAEAAVNTATGAQISAGSSTYLAAGATVWVTALSSVGQNAQLRGFSIHRIAAQGPIGPQGPAGPSTPIPLVTVLPSSPVDGQEVYYQNASMATAGAAWRLRYNSASASTYKWEFIGGSSIRANVDTDESFASGTGYVDAVTVGPQITLPLAGDYTYVFAASLYIAGQTAGGTPVAALGLGGAQPAAPDVSSNYTIAANGIQAGKPGLLASQPASRIVKMMYGAGTAMGGTPHTRWRDLQITPVRVS